MRPPVRYRGRFAPSPTGPLHVGSLVAAVGSYLEARRHGGEWLVRIEDLDTPRVQKGAADRILQTLERFGFEWPEPVLYQSTRDDAYAAALDVLRQSGLVYPCICTRREVADSAVRGADGHIYPGTCRSKTPTSREKFAWRVRTDGSHVRLEDALQGPIAQELEREIGDFVVCRSDGLFAYQLAVVVDDAFQGITHVVRGADLLVSAPRQRYLQSLLGLPPVEYAHLPVVLDANGEKLSKQTLATPVDPDNPSPSLVAALTLLRQSPPPDLAGATVPEIWQWAFAHWNPLQLRGVRQVTIAA